MCLENCQTWYNASSPSILTIDRIELYRSRHPLQRLHSYGTSCDGDVSVEAVAKN